MNISKEIKTQIRDFFKTGIKEDLKTSIKDAPLDELESMAEIAYTAVLDNFEVFTIEHLENIFEIFKNEIKTRGGKKAVFPRFTKLHKELKAEAKQLAQAKAEETNEATFQVDEQPVEEIVQATTPIEETPKVEQPVVTTVEEDTREFPIVVKFEYPLDSKKAANLYNWVNGKHFKSECKRVDDHTLAFLEDFDYEQLIVFGLVSDEYGEELDKLYGKQTATEKQTTATTVKATTANKKDATPKNEKSDKKEKFIYNYFAKITNCEELNTLIEKVRSEGKDMYSTQFGGKVTKVKCHDYDRIIFNNKQFDKKGFTKVNITNLHKNYTVGALDADAKLVPNEEKTAKLKEIKTYAELIELVGDDQLLSTKRNAAVKDWSLQDKYVEIFIDGKAKSAFSYYRVLNSYYEIK